MVTVSAFPSCLAASRTGLTVNVKSLPAGRTAAVAPRVPSAASPRIHQRYRSAVAPWRRQSVGCTSPAPDSSSRPPRPAPNGADNWSAGTGVPFEGGYALTAIRTARVIPCAAISNDDAHYGAPDGAREVCGTTATSERPRWGTCNELVTPSLTTSRIPCKTKHLLVQSPSRSTGPIRANSSVDDSGPHSKTARRYGSVRSHTRSACPIPARGEPAGAHPGSQSVRPSAHRGRRAHTPGELRHRAAVRGIPGHPVRKRRRSPRPAQAHQVRRRAPRSLYDRDPRDAPAAHLSRGESRHDCHHDYRQPERGIESRGAARWRVGLYAQAILRHAPPDPARASGAHRARGAGVERDPGRVCPGARQQ